MLERDVHLLKLGSVVDRRMGSYEEEEQAVEHNHHLNLPGVNLCRILQHAKKDIEGRPLPKAVFEPSSAQSLS
jgi:hypothetical protein